MTGLLVIIMALVILFYRFQLRMIEKASLARTDLLRAQAQLEEQNSTLEQRVQERTLEVREFGREAAPDLRECFRWHQHLRRHPQ